MKAVKLVTNGAHPEKSIRLFYSYSHRDETLRGELETHLAVLRRNGLIAEWHDRMIGAGADWKGQIDQQLAAADIVLLLVSADFIASDYCWDKEMTKALDRHQLGEARVIPVILRSCQWQRTPFSGLQAVPKDGKPVSEWPDRDAAFNEIAAAIGCTITDLQQQRRRAAEQRQQEAEEARKRAEAEAHQAAEEREREAQRRRAAEQRQQEAEEARKRAEAEAHQAARLRLMTAIGLMVLVGFAGVMTWQQWPETDRKPQEIPSPAPARAVPPDCEICPEMVVVPAGTFIMGSPDSEPDRSPDEGPQKTVLIDHNFMIGKYEVTIEEWQRCQFKECKDVIERIKNDKYIKNITDEKHELQLPGKYPIMDVRWDEVQVYLKWLNKNTNNRFNYRLPSEAEWEYAARAGKASARYWGDGIEVGNANCINCGTTPVGSFKRNTNGFYDMSGNVWEWVDSECTQESCLEELYGGSWDNLRLRVMSSMSTPLWAKINQSAPTFGFRVAVKLNRDNSPSLSPDGTFREHNDKRLPLIKVIDQFGLGVYEVRVKEWNECVRASKCKEKVGQNGDEHPIKDVSKEDAEEYLQWLTDLSDSRRTYRLPTASEWKKAASAETNTPLSCDDSTANCIDCGSHGPAEVGLYGNNSYGLFDMLGNVWEWTQDCYHDKYDGVPKEVLQKGIPWEENKGCDLRVARGGSWDNLPQRIRSAARHRFGSKKDSDTIGFRIARDFISTDAHR